MTSIVVTASSFASASEVAFLVASFIQFLPRPWGALGSVRETRQASLWQASSLPVKACDDRFNADTPPTSIRFSKSPHSEYRHSKVRPVMRRDFVADCNRLWRSHDFIAATSRPVITIKFVISGCFPGTIAGLSARWLNQNPPKRRRPIAHRRNDDRHLMVIEGIIEVLEYQAGR